jgi:hypothetical protein
MRARRCLLLFLLAALAGPVAAEDLALTTYYPSPRAVYRELRTTHNALLASQGGVVLIGSGVTPVETLHPESRFFLVAPTLRTNPTGPTSCPAGYLGFDDDRDGALEVNECHLVWLGLRGGGGGRLESAAPALDLLGPLGGGTFRLRQSNDSAAGTVLSWNRPVPPALPSPSGRTITLHGTTTIGENDASAPERIQNLAVTGRVHVQGQRADPPIPTSPAAALQVDEGLFLPGRFDDDGRAAASTGTLPVPEGALYYRRLPLGAAQYRSFQNGQWRTFGGAMRWESGWLAYNTAASCPGWTSTSRTCKYQFTFTHNLGLLPASIILLWRQNAASEIVNLSDRAMAVLVSQRAVIVPDGNRVLVGDHVGHNPPSVPATSGEYQLILSF